MRKLRHEEIPRIAPEEMKAGSAHPITLILEDIRSAHNVGSIMRSADATHIQEVVVTGITPGPDHRSARKTALGAEDTVAWRQEPDAIPTIQALRERGFSIAVLELTDAPRSVNDLGARDFPLCIIAGNEVDGVSDTVVAAADFALEIPQYGSKQSLNVSVAVGIALFDLVRSWRTLNGKPIRPSAPFLNS